MFFACVVVSVSSIQNYATVTKTKTAGAFSSLATTAKQSAVFISTSTGLLERAAEQQGQQPLPSYKTRSSKAAVQRNDKKTAGEKRRLPRGRCFAAIGASASLRTCSRLR